MDPKWAPYAVMAELLDSLSVALCLFDAGDHAVLWNRTFLRLFPEHDGAVHEGEHYSANLRRFYLGRLAPAEMAQIDRYIADGIQRHRSQSRPYVFEHRGQWVRVGALPVPEGGRVRVWTPIASPTVASGMAGIGLQSGPGDRALMEKVADGVMITDPAGQIIQVNEQLIGLYGVTRREEIVGQRYEALLAAIWQGAPEPEPGLRTVEAWAAALIEHRRFAGAPFEVALPRDRWLRVTEQPAADGVIYSSHVDITMMKRQQRATDAAKAAADQANAAKSAFLAMISHEIRTPMNGIIGMNHLLIDSGLTPRQRQFADTIARSAVGLLEIIDTLLDVSKLEAGKLTIERLPCDLDDVIADAVQLVLPRAMKRGLALTVAPRRLAGSLTFLGDPTRLRQVLLNLLSNAVKFTERGSITVETEPTRVGEADGVRVTVSDTGIGIEPAVAETLFRPFAQADGSIARRFGGTGLGLHISRQLVQLMGGAIGVEPRPGGGSRFWFTLPLPPLPGVDAVPIDPGPHAPARLDGAAQAQAMGGRILVVEDNIINQMLVTELLGEAGFVVTIAEDGPAALREIEACLSQKRLPELILMDIQLPGMDGLAVTRAIKARALAAAQVPVIALTANAMDSDRQACLAAGMVDFISKPFEPDRLIQLATRWIGLGRAGA